jgi:hypothetical protein
MPPGNYTLNLYRGDTYRWQFTLWADEAKTEPADLTDVIPKAEIRDKPAGAQIADIECVVELPNIILATLPAATSHALPQGNTTAWDLQLTYASGDVATILGGRVTVTPDVTDSG